MANNDGRFDLARALAALAYARKVLLGASADRPVNLWADAIAMRLAQWAIIALIAMAITYPLALVGGWGVSPLTLWAGSFIGQVIVQVGLILYLIGRAAWPLWLSWRDEYDRKRKAKAKQKIKQAGQV